MNATELTTLSMSQLKNFCTSHAIEVVGDKRAKSTYILAIETFQSEQTIIEIIEMPATPDPFDDAIEVDQSIDLPPVHTTQHHGASIVMLTPLILLTVGRSLVAVWGFSNREDEQASFVLISSAQP
jgi:hypothetical protein